MRQDECKMEPSFCIAALVAEAKLEQSDQITTMGKHQAKLGRVRDVLDYTQAHSTGGATIYQKFLVLLRDSGSYDQVLSVFEYLRDSRCLQDDPLYGIVVTAMIKWKKRDLVLKLLDDMDKSNVPLRLFTEVAVTAAPTNQQQLILEILDYIHKHHAAVDFSPVYTSAIRAAFKVNEFDFVLTILRKMKISGLDAGGEYSLAVMSLNEAGQYDRLLCVFEEMRECGYFVEKALYKATVVAAVHLEKRGVVLEICGETISRDITSREVYSFLLKTARWGQEHDLVELLLPKVDKKVASDVILDSHLKGTTNRAAAYSAALQELSKLGQWDVVLDVFREVQNEGLKPTMAVAFGESRKYRDVSVVPDIYAMMPMELRQQLQSKQLRTMFLVLAKSDRKDLAQAEEIMHEYVREND
ncbi:hypothetical protein Pcac1_g3122 [Phytophthora cactorum]|nr:hypothetical protein Pcac1_g3122 [Phytophthora cactorum]